MDKFEPQGRDPEQESHEGCLIGQLGAEGCRARAYCELAVVEFRAYRGPCLADESNLICL